MTAPLHPVDPTTGLPSWLLPVTTVVVGIVSGISGAAYYAGQTAADLASVKTKLIDIQADVRTSQADIKTILLRQKP